MNEVCVMNQSIPQVPSDSRTFALPGLQMWVFAGDEGKRVDSSFDTRLSEDHTGVQQQLLHKDSHL